MTTSDSMTTSDKETTSVKAAWLAILPLAILGLATTAEARIRCKDGYQIVQGSPIATPYCQDNQLAQIARAQGIAVSDAAVRNNPNLKRHVCQLIGRDNRTHMACINAFPGRRGF